MNTNYIDELNESQCAAVTYNDGPSLVIAGHEPQGPRHLRPEDQEGQLLPL